MVGLGVTNEGWFMAEWLVLGVMLRIFVALVCAGGKEKELE